MSTWKDLSPAVEEGETTEEIAEVWKVSKTKARRRLAELEERGIVMRVKTMRKNRAGHSMPVTGWVIQSEEHGKA